MIPMILGAGVGRTGTSSLKLALTHLGVGPCHHMQEVRDHMPVQVPLWRSALAGNADWAAIYDGYSSAVDWPTAAFFRELAANNPEARFILTVRSSESWAESFSETVYIIGAAKEKVPPHMREWLEILIAVIARSGFPLGLDRPALAAAFVAHNEAVRTAIPAERLLVYNVTDGWAPLCAFLGQPVPSQPFPRRNRRRDFWSFVKSAGPHGKRA